MGHEEFKEGHRVIGFLVIRLWVVVFWGLKSVNHTNRGP